MAILSNLLVNGESRLLGKLYTNDISIGNNVEIAGKTTTAQLYVKTTMNNNTNYSVNSDNLPFVVGTITGRHIVMDSDEITAKNGATGASTLYLNYGGGQVNLSTNAKIVANDGTLTAPTISNTTLTSTTATITTGNITDIHATNIDVSDTLRATRYSIETVQNLGGHFLVCPTIEVPSDTTGVTNPVTFQMQVQRTSNTQLKLTIIDQSFANDTFPSSTGTKWTANSKVKVSGTINNIPLGTCDGVITSWTTSNKTVVLTITCGVATKFSTTATNYTASQVQEFSAMLYELYNSNGNTYPIGVYLTAYGKNKYSYVDVYGGTSNTPSVRMGKLDGLPTVNDITPTGWGFYSDGGSDGSGGGYFGGKLVSPSGKIGGFTIGSNAIYSSANALGTTDNNVYIGTEGISLGTTFKVTKGGAITATSGTIGGFSMDAEMLKSGDPGTSGSVFMTKAYHGTTSIGGGSSDSWRIGAGTSFGVTNTGTLYCNDIQASGGKIGGLAIDATSIHTYNVAVTSNADNSIALSSADFTRTILSTSRAGLRFAIGDKFGVTGDGVLYTNGANITNLSASNISTGTLSAERIGAGTISIGKLDATTQANIKDGNLLLDYADLTSSNWKKESSVTVAYDSSVGMYKVTDTAHTSSRYGIYQDFVVSPNTTYTFSVDIKRGSNVAYACVGSVSGSAWSGSFPNTYKVTSIDGNTVRQSVTFTTGASDGVGRVYLNIHPTVANQYAYFALPKLILGTSVEAANYITQIDSNGIWVTPSGKKPTNTSTGAGATGTKIDGTNGVQIYNNGIKLAEYSSGIKLYQPNGTQVVDISTSGATFKGAINATSGFIGENSTNGFNISSKSIWNGISTQNAASGTGIYLGTDGINLGGGKFNVTKAGFLTSTSGKIGGWDIGTDMLSLTDTYFTAQFGKVTSTITGGLKATLKITGSKNNVDYKTEFGISETSKAEPYINLYSGTQSNSDLNHIYSSGIFLFSDDTANSKYYQSEYSFNHITLGYQDSEQNPFFEANESGVFAKNIGVVYSQTTATKISSTDINTRTKGAKITLPAGTYIVTGTWVFNTGSSSGARTMQVGIQNSSGTLLHGAYERISSANNYYAVLTCTFAGELDAGDYYVSGSSSMTYTTNADTIIRAVRIK